MGITHHELVFGNDVSLIGKNSPWGIIGSSPVRRMNDGNYHFVDEYKAMRIGRFLNCMRYGRFECPSGINKHRWLAMLTQYNNCLRQNLNPWWYFGVKWDE